LAREKQENVPVLIICTSRREAFELKAKLEEVEKKVTKGAECTIQVFSELDHEEKMKLDWNTLVSNATEVEVVPGSNKRRITTTYAFGGRGFDFDVKDDHANAHHGLLVIALTVPAERDWVQWKGRTARSDRNGQVAVILSTEDPFLKDPKNYDNYKVSNSQDRYTAGLIDYLLVQHDLGTGEKLKDQAELTFEGQRLNELSDFFHTHFNSGGSVGTVTEWPRPMYEKQDNAFSEFLASQKNSSEEIRDFAAIWGFPYDSLYPKSGGRIHPKPVIPPKRVSFIVDYSGSMNSTDGRQTTRLNEAIDKVLKIYDDSNLISDRDYVSFTLFDHQYTEVFPFKLKGPTSRATIDSSREVRGYTAFYDAIKEGLNKFRGSPQTKVQGGDWMIILTDGDDSHSKSTESNCITLLKASDANVFIIGFMLSPGSKAKISLDNIYTTVDSDRVSVLNADNDRALAEVFAKIGEAMAQGPLMLE